MNLIWQLNFDLIFCSFILCKNFFLFLSHNVSKYVLVQVFNLCSFRASGQIYNKSFLPDSGDRPGNHGHRGYSQGLGQHHQDEPCKQGWSLGYAKILQYIPRNIKKSLPGASFSRTLFVASGVTSRGENPVPPVVRMSWSLSSSVHLRRKSRILSWSSDTHERRTIFQPANDSFRIVESQRILCMFEINYKTCHPT